MALSSSCHWAFACKSSHAGNWISVVAGSLSLKGVAQMLVADPGVGSASHKLAQIFRYGQDQPHLRMRLWMPANTRLQPDSPWLPLAISGTLFSQPHLAPALLLISDAADWREAQRIYGQRPDLPKLHLLHGADLRQWGYGALAQPAVRVALGEAVAEGLRRSQRLREPLHVLPVCLDPETLPAPSLVKQGCLVLARRHPALGLAVQQGLLAEGISCRCELSPWPRHRWQQAMAEAAVVVQLASPGREPGLGVQQLAAMAMGAALVLDEPPLADGFLRDGYNALVRLADAVELTQSAVQLLRDGSLRDRLVQGGKATLLRHRCALERLRFQELLHQLPDHWSAARAAHAITSLSS
jgi:hypothetical protein